jgi:rod shape determining protein RodA
MKTWFIPSVMFFLCCIGLLALRSVAPSLVGQQLTFALLGGGVFWWVSRYRYQQIEELGWLGYIGVCLLLLLPLIIGKTTRGIAGWIDIGGFFSIQPSQLAVPIIGLSMAQWCAQQDLTRLESLFKTLLMMLLPGVLIVVEPDLGTAVVYVLSMGAILFMSNVKWSYLLGMASLGVVAVGISWLFFLEPYQQARITSFIGIGDAQESSDASYNARQSLIAVGSGQVFGRGLGQGVQSHLRFLPERQTDFIFASLSEELGFVGASLVVVLYWALIAWCLWLSWWASSVNARLYAIGCAAMLTVQCGVNIGMNVGIVPITGITLPFVSYGGSSLLSMAGMLGILQSISKEVVPRPVLHLS